MHANAGVAPAFGLFNYPRFHVFAGWRSVLPQKGVTYPMYLARTPDPETLIRAVGGGWQGDLPQTFLYDRQGHLVKTLAQSHTLPELEALVKPYLRHSEAASIRKYDTRTRAMRARG